MNTTPEKNDFSSLKPRKNLAKFFAWIAGGVLVVFAALAVLFFRFMSQENPTWQSLQVTPNAALHGTVAYFDDTTLCVRVVSASGVNAKDVLCIDQNAMNDKVHQSKEVGVNLRWLSDNRLELTMWVMRNGPTPKTSFFPEWQRIYDVQTLKFTQTPTAEIPLKPLTNSQPVVNLQGDRLITESDSGHVVVTMVSANGVRKTLIDVQGNPKSYHMNKAFWSPDFKYVVSDDYQLLFTTLGAAPKTMSITPSMTTFYGYDAIDWFAVTAQDLLS
jgi:hypothetical protein